VVYYNTRQLAGQEQDLGKGWGERLTPVTRDTGPAFAVMADNVAILACMVHLP